MICSSAVRISDHKLQMVKHEKTINRDRRCFDSMCFNGRSLEGNNA